MAEAGIEPGDQAGVPGLCFEQRVQVVEQRVGGIDRQPRRTGQE
jgi:hypothetical protein